MEKNTEFRTNKPHQDRSFRVVVRNLHPSKEIQHIKRAIMEKDTKSQIFGTLNSAARTDGGTAIIIWQNVKHNIREENKQEHVQATSIALQDDTGELNIAAVYSPPKHAIKEVHYTRFFHTLRQRFLAGGDYNAKHVMWGARITTTEGRELYKTMTNNNLQYLSTCQPTFWPSDTNRQPDLLDFCIVKGINTQNLKSLRA